MHLTPKYIQFKYCFAAVNLKLIVPRRGLVKLMNSTAAGALKIAAGAQETGAGA
jgi:hypothetical protein